MPKLVALLAESYNPHVRYGACMAVGISCARTGSAEAIRLLEPMLTDVSDFVRQVRLWCLVPARVPFCLYSALCLPVRL